MGVFPLLIETATVGQFDLHLVGARDEFKTAIFRPLRVHNHHDLHEFRLAHVLIGGSVDVRDESIGTGEFIVDLVLEQQHLLFSRH